MRSETPDQLDPEQFQTYQAYSAKYIAICGMNEAMLTLASLILLKNPSLIGSWANHAALVAVALILFPIVVLMVTFEHRRRWYDKERQFYLPKDVHFLFMFLGAAICASIAAGIIVIGGLIFGPRLLP